MTRWVWPQHRFADPDLRAHGCGASAMLAALVRASDGGWRPRGRAGTTSALFRVRASGVAPAEFRARGLTASEVWRSLDAVHATDERMGLRAQVRHGVDVLGDLLPQLARIDGCACVAVDYGVVRRAGLGGRGSYRGGHWVLVGDPGDGHVDVADSLRERLVTWPVDVLADAMASFGARPWGHGRGEAVVVWPWRTWREGYETVRGQRDEARADLAACRAQA